MAPEEGCDISKTLPPIILYVAIVTSDAGGDGLSVGVEVDSGGVAGVVPAGGKELDKIQSGVNTDHFRIKILNAFV